MYRDTFYDDHIIKYRHSNTKVCTVRKLYLIKSMGGRSGNSGSRSKSYSKSRSSSHGSHDSSSKSTKNPSRSQSPSQSYSNASVLGGMSMMAFLLARHRNLKKRRTQAHSHKLKLKCEQLRTNQ